MPHLKRYTVGLTVVAIIATVVLLNSRSPVQAAPERQSSIIIADSSFSPADWTILEEKTGSPSSTTTQQTYGNSTNYRHTQDTFPAVGPADFYRQTMFHFFEPSTWDPAVDGSIASITYQADNILLGATPAHPSPTVYDYFIIIQDGVIYRGGETVVDNTTWQTTVFTELQANDFYPFAGFGGETHPDFSEQGALITFGYARFNYRSFSYPPIPNDQVLVYEHGIANWQVTIHRSTTAPPNRAPIANNDEYIFDRFDYLMPFDMFVLDNDYDPDLDRLMIIEATDSDTGQTTSSEFDVIWTWDKQNGFGPDGMDTFTYTISDGALTDTATVRMYIDCGCSISCADVAYSNFSPATVQSTTAATDTLDLELIYRLRDNVMKPTPQGSRYVQMYYQTTPEIVRILMLNRPDLGAAAVDVVELWQANLYSLVDGDGSAVVTQAQVNAIETFLANLSAAGSAELQQLIAAELARLDPLDDYVGLTVKEAKRQAIGDATVYLPIVLK
ncbi:MAG: hypothetical protein KDF65_03670 [Anaerolineae bacterium]|nr:hypothetical protein [Anaerolineae bacterium]